MDTIPYFLILLKNNTLLYSIILTGNLSLIENDYTGKYEFWTKQAVELTNFKLSEQDSFSKVWIDISDDTTTISFEVDDSKYFNKHLYYFGDNTIYSHIEKEIKAKGISVKNPLTYDFKNFNPPLFISLRKSNSYGYVIDVKSTYNK